MSDKTREDVEILGVNHTLAIDPDSLNEAGVVWAPAVRALASAIAPIVVAEAEKVSTTALKFEAERAALIRDGKKNVELVKQVRGLVRDLKQWSAPKGHSPGAPLFDIEEGQAGASDGEGWSPRARPAITEEADEEPSRYV